MLAKLYPKLDCLVTLVSVHDALLAERELDRQNIRIVPTPQELDLSCGQSLLCALDEAAEIRVLLERVGVRCGFWHKRSEAGWVKMDEESAKEGTVHRVTEVTEKRPEKARAFEQE